MNSWPKFSKTSEPKDQRLHLTQKVLNLPNGTEKQPLENLLRLLSKSTDKFLTDGWPNTSRKHGADMT